jgi:hypothetical protein
MSALLFPSLVAPRLRFFRSQTALSSFARFALRCCDSAAASHCGLSARCLRPCAVVCRELSVVFAAQRFARCCCSGKLKLEPPIVRFPLERWVRPGWNCPGWAQPAGPNRLGSPRLGLLRLGLRLGSPRLGSPRLLTALRTSCRLAAAIVWRCSRGTSSV